MEYRHWISNHFKIFCSNFISKNSVQVLATLIYISYSKLIRIPIDIFSVEYAEYDTDTHMHNLFKNETIWPYNGDGYGTSNVHRIYIFLGTLSVFLFLLPYTFVTTFSYYLVRYRIINRFRPFIDAYGGPFKVKMRFWFGLRLWIFAILYIVNGALQGSNTDNNNMLISHSIIIFAFILFQTYLQPYKNTSIGKLDLLFMILYFLNIFFFLVLSDSAFN